MPIVVAATAAVAVGACGGGDEPAAAAPTSTSPEASSLPAAAGDPDAATTVDVRAGAFVDEPMISTLVRYLDERQTSMREHGATAGLVSTSTYQWLQQQRGVIATADQRGWTVPAAATMIVHSVTGGSPDALVGLCLWGPSVDFIDARTLEPVRRTPAQWYPFDVKMVFTGDRWLVAGAAQGEFRCEDRTP